jgi:hypothetical protein
VRLGVLHILPPERTASISVASRYAGNRRRFSVADSARITRLGAVGTWRTFHDRSIVPVFPPRTISSLHMHDRSAFGLVQNRAGTYICEKCYRQPSSNRALIAGFCIQPRGICPCSDGVGYLPMDEGWFSFSSVPKYLTSAWLMWPGKSVGLTERDVLRIKTPFPLEAGWRRILRGFN